MAFLLGVPVAVGCSVAALGVDPVVIAMMAAINLVFVIFFVRHCAFAISASRWAGRDVEDAGRIGLTYQPRVSILVACHNEEKVVATLVTGLDRLIYPRKLLQVILIDDGSSDATGARLDELTAALAGIEVLHRPVGAGGGKSGALNAALSQVTGEVVVIFDADHIPEPDSVARLARHFIDPVVDAVQGRCVVRNALESTLARAIAIDYFSGYLVNEYGRQALYGLPAYGGANCAVRRSTLVSLGGWNRESVTEDTDLTLRVLLRGGRVRYDITAVDTEEAVGSLARFVKQRYRWARGHQQVWRDYRSGVLRTPYLDAAGRWETLLFLLVYHVPVLCMASLVMTLLRIVGIGPNVSLVELLPLAALLFVGPYCELAVGLLVGKAPRRSAWALLWLTPLFVIFMAICSKAWLDGMLGRPYTWSKTARTSWQPGVMS